MSHQINPQIDTVYTPNNELFASTWHGLQTIIQESEIAKNGSNVPLVFNPIIEGKANLSFPDIDIDADTQKELDKWKIICADCRKGKSGKIHPVHIPRESYTIHQNKTLFDCMVKSANSVLGENGFQIATVGTLDSYKQFFVSIAIKGQDSFDVGNGDNWKQFFNLFSSHNSLMTSSRMLSMVRIVCMNTVLASVHDSQQNGTRSAIRHTKNSLELLTPEAFEKDLHIWLNECHSYQSAIKAMKTVSMDLQAFKSFACGVFTLPESEGISVKSYNRVESLATLFVRGVGNSGQSAYDALNAFTEYFTHGEGIGKGKNIAKEKRVARANFGKANDWKKQAFIFLSDETMFKQAIERGERLLNDYSSKK